jgi:phosphocarrier protein
MIEVEVRIENPLGLHARAAARFVHLANRFEACITVASGAARVDGKSILGLLMLAAPQGSRLRLSADGADEQDALAQLTQLVRDGLGDPG